MRPLLALVGLLGALGAAHAYLACPGAARPLPAWLAARPGAGVRGPGTPGVGRAWGPPPGRSPARGGLLRAVASEQPRAAGGGGAEQRAEGGSVYMVATPIGNLEDMTIRAVSILRSVDYVVSEDTRRTGTLLKHFGVSAKQISHHEHNWQQKAPEIVSMAQTGASFAVVSDAGTPGISDPGMQLAQMCHAAGVPVRPVPGACAAAAGISVSGMGSGEFLFKGFLPAKGQERERAVERVCACPCAVVLYEAPHRVLSTLQAIGKTQGGRGVLIGRELTKLHEEVYRGTVDEVIERLETQEGSIRGEFTIVLQELTSGGGKDMSDQDEERAKQMLTALCSAGVSVSAAGKAVSAALGMPKNKIKKLSLRLSQEARPDGGSEGEDEDDGEPEKAAEAADADSRGGAGGGGKDALFSVLGVDHLVLRAKDPAAMEAFYMRVLNCTLAKRNEAAQMSHLRIGDALIDIVAAQEGSPAAGDGKGEPRNMDHFAINVAPFDPDQIRAHLQSLGLDPSPAVMRYGAYGDGISIYFNDCEGNSVELKGRPGT